VVVVGGGPAGLSVAGALSRVGRAAVVLERDNRVGTRWANRYDGLHLHTVRRYSGLAHIPIPRAQGRYVSKDGYASYLREYVTQLALDVRTGTDVSAVRPHRGLWGIESEETNWLAPVVVLATGRHDEPAGQDLPGAGDYRGRLLHSAAYRSPDEFRGRSILVVGLGNSGVEIAAELAGAGAAVAVAVRTPPPITQREVLGVPVQLLGILLARFPGPVVDRVGAALRRIRIGDLRKYGLEAAAWEPFTAKRPPVIDAGFLRELKLGRVEVRRAVVRLTPTGADFADGTTGTFDAVIAATGFRTALPLLLDLPDLLDDSGCPGNGRQYPGLYSIGYSESIRGALFEINRTSRSLARSISSYLERPRPLL
jgi:cation diffusion facilitator CzcD-associated flavoprotein CzcO